MDEAALCAEAPDADEIVEGGWSKICETEGDGDPEDGFRRMDCATVCL